MNSTSVGIINSGEQTNSDLKSNLESYFQVVNLYHWPECRDGSDSLEKNDILLAVSRSPDQEIMDWLDEQTDKPVILLSDIPQAFDLLAFLRKNNIYDHIPLGNTDRLIDSIRKCITDTMLMSKRSFSLRNNPYVKAYDHEGIILTDRKGYIIWVNQECENFTGYKLHELRGKKPSNVFQGPDTNPDTIARMSAYIKKGEGFVEEVLNYRKNDEPYWLRIKVSPVKGEDGNVRQFIAFQEDISMQKELQTNLSETLAIFSRAQDIGNLGHWSFDIKDQDVYWSDKIFEIYGRDPKKSVPDFDELKELIAPDYREHWLSEVERGISSGTEHDLKIKLNTKEPVYIRSIGIPVKNEKGEITGLEGIVQDVTEMEVTKQELMALNHQLQDMADNIEGLLLQYKLNPDGSDELLYISEGVERIFNLSREDAITDNSKVWDKVVEEDKAKVHNDILQSAQTMSNFLSSWRVQNPDGGISIVKASGSPRKQDDGSVLWNTVIIDITNEVQGERDRTELNEVISGTLNEIYIFSAKTLKFTYANQTALTNLKYSEGEIRALTPYDVKPGIDKMQFKDLLKRADREEGVHLDTIHQRKDGSTYPVYLNIKPGRFKGKKVFITNAMDASLIKEQQYQLQNMIDEKNILIGEINHRVKNNLAIISGLIELHTMKNDNAELQEVQNRIHLIAAVHEQLYNTNDFSRIKIESYLQSLVENTMKSVSGAEEMVELEIKTEIDHLNINEAVPMGLLINELLVNSLKHAFSDKGGSIFIALLKADNDHLRFVYSDTGKGFDKSIIEKATLGEAGFGLVLIKTLISQFSDHYQLDGDDGFHLSFTFDRLSTGAHGTFEPADT